MVFKTDEYMGDSELFGACARAAPKIFAYARPWLQWVVTK